MRSLLAMTGIVWRTRRRAVILWTMALSATMAFTAIAVAGLYDTPAKIQGYADAVTSGSALVAINGRVEGINTLGGVIQDEFGFLASFLLPLLGISLVAASTRRDEQLGRLELLLAGRIRRSDPTTAALLVAGAAIVTTPVLFAAGLVAAGVPVAGAVLYSLALGALAFVFAGLAAVLAQVVPYSRGVYTWSLIILVVAYVTRGVGDVKGLWITWLSPLGWAEKASPFAAQRWWTLLVPLAVGTGLGAAAVALARRRDLGSSLRRSGAGPERASAALRSPLGLATRIHAPAALGWLAGGVLLAGMLGALAQPMLDALGANSSLAQAMGIDRGDLTNGFLAATQLYVAIIACGYVVQAVGALRAEEAEGRLETRLAGVLSRRAWLGAQAAVVATGLLVVVLVPSWVLAVTANWSTGGSVSLSAVMGAGLAYLPAELLLGGLALALFGIRPRLFALAWLVYGVTVFVAFLGPSLHFRQVVLDLSPTTHVGYPPLDPVQVGGLVVLGAVAAVLVAVGFGAFRSRGIPQG